MSIREVSFQFPIRLPAKAPAGVWMCNHQSFSNTNTGNHPRYLHKIVGVSIFTVSAQPYDI